MGRNAEFYDQIDAIRADSPNSDEEASGDTPGDEVGNTNGG